MRLAVVKLTTSITPQQKHAPIPKPRNSDSLALKYTSGDQGTKKKKKKNEYCHSSDKLRSPILEAARQSPRPSGAF